MIDVYHFCMAMYHKAIKKNTVLVVGSKKGGE